MQWASTWTRAELCAVPGSTGRAPKGQRPLCRGHAAGETGFLNLPLMPVWDLGARTRKGAKKLSILEWRLWGQSTYHVTGGDKGPSTGTSGHLDRTFRQQRASGSFWDRNKWSEQHLGKMNLAGDAGWTEREGLALTRCFWRKRMFFGRKEI